MLWIYGTNGIFIVQSTGTKLFALNCLSFGFFVFLDSKKQDYTLRVFNLKSTSGSFEATEVLNPARSEHIMPYPILQSQLYSADQPGKLELLRLGMKSFFFPLPSSNSSYRYFLVHDVIPVYKVALQFSPSFFVCLLACSCLRLFVHLKCKYTQESECLPAVKSAVVLFIMNYSNKICVVFLKWSCHCCLFL